MRIFRFLEIYRRALGIPGNFYEFSKGRNSGRRETFPDFL